MYVDINNLIPILSCFVSFIQLKDIRRRYKCRLIERSSFIIASEWNLTNMNIDIENYLSISSNCAQMKSIWYNEFKNSACALRHSSSVGYITPLYFTEGIFGAENNISINHILITMSPEIIFFRVVL